ASPARSGRAWRPASTGGPSTSPRSWPRTRCAGPGGAARTGSWRLAGGGGATRAVTTAAPPPPRLPILAVPTTYAGTEMTPVWGITTDGHKTTGRDPMVRPRTVVYDPLLTLSLPSAVTAA